MKFIPFVTFPALLLLLAMRFAHQWDEADQRAMIHEMCKAHELSAFQCFMHGD